MGLSKTIWSKPAEYLHHHMPQDPVRFFAPGVLQDTARRFIDGLPGAVSYVVAANPAEVVIENLAAAGLRNYHVATLAEMRMIRHLAPEATMHLSAPPRSRADLALALELGVKSFAVESAAQLALVLDVAPVAVGLEIVVRLDTARPDLAVTLLGQVADAGGTPALGLDCGDQLSDAARLIGVFDAAKSVAMQSGNAVAQIHMRGEFQAADRAALKAALAQASGLFHACFGETGPTLVWAIGGGIVADCVSLAARVTTLGDGVVRLRDDAQGTLTAQVKVAARPLRLDFPNAAATGAALTDTAVQLIAGHDKLLPALVPDDLTVGDYVVLHGLGAVGDTQSALPPRLGATLLQTVLMLR